MKKYRKLPVVIEAVQFTKDGVNSYVIQEWSGCDVGADYLVFHTLEGTMYAQYEDWIIKGVRGEFYPCKPDIFEAIYELAE